MQLSDERKKRMAKKGGKSVGERQRPGLKGDFSGTDWISSPKKLTGKDQIGFR